MNLIYQYYIPYSDTIETSLQYSVDDFKEYSKKYKTDYIFKDVPFMTFPDSLKKHEVYYNKLIAIIYDKSLDKYDNILYVDTDIVVDDFEHNIFDEVNNNNDADIVLIGDEYLMPIYYLKGHWKEMMNIFSNEYREPTYFVNSGVMLWTKKGRLKARERFVDFQDWVKYTEYNIKDDDEFYLNAMLSIHDFKIKYLSEQWNYREDNTSNRLKERIIRTEKPIFHHFLFNFKKKIEAHKNGQ